jgi:oligopeptide/dipeptide ABC transporter ATP-binding protein
MTADPLLVVEDLVKEFAELRAVDGLSFAVERGETFGIVGESGSGKTTLSRTILRLLEPTSGRVRFDGTDVLGLGTRELRQMRRRLQIVFQDPFGSLDPRMTARGIVAEPLEIHGVGDRADRARRAGEMLEAVGIPAAQHRRRPHAFSGGQRQRIGVARALVVQPELVFLDEPISALDVSIQAQVLNLLRRLQRELSLTYVFIVHDLAVAEYFCDRIAVLYRGAIVELGDRESLFREPLHPYTSALLSAVPIPDPDAKRRDRPIVVSGDLPHDEGSSTGCRFRARCPIGRGREACSVAPPLAEHRPGHWAACHFPAELETAGITPETRPGEETP